MVAGSGMATVTLGPGAFPRQAASYALPPGQQIKMIIRKPRALGPGRRDLRPLRRPPRIERFEVT